MLLITAAVVLAPGTAQAPWSDANTYAIAGLVNQTALPANCSVRAGQVVKRPDPIMVQSEPWEFRLDNGYPNVVHAPGDPLGEWRLWYHSHISGHNFNSGCGTDRTSGWLTANSSDGIHWEKPSLGLFSLGNGSAQCRINPELCEIGTANNIINTFPGAGVMRDQSPMLRSESERFKAFIGSKTNSTFVSVDGLRWLPAIGP